MACLKLVGEILFSILLLAGILHLAAYMSGLGYKGYGAAVAWSLSVHVLWFCTLVIAMFTACLPCVAFLILLAGFGLTIYLIQSIYEISLPRAIGMWLLSVLITFGIDLLIIGPRVYQAFLGKTTP
jgi:hypothetical protein